MNLINLNRDNTLMYYKRNYPSRIIYYNIDGVSSDNEYIPLFSPLINRGIYQRKIVHYSIMNPVRGATYSLTNYAKLYKALETAELTQIFRTASMEKGLYATKGMLFSKDTNGNPNILFLIALKEDYMIKLMTEDRTNPDLSKFVIFISKDFITKDEHKTIYRKMNKEIIIPHLEMGVDIVITNNIADKCFKNEIVLPKFRSVAEMKQHLNAFNSVIYGETTEESRS